MDWLRRLRGEEEEEEGGSELKLEGRVPARGRRRLVEEEDGLLEAAREGVIEDGISRGWEDEADEGGRLDRLPAR